MTKTDRRLRLSVWAAGVCGLSAFLLWAVLPNLKTQDNDRPEMAAQMLKRVREASLEYIRSLYANAESVAADRELYRLALSRDPLEVAGAFDRLAGYPRPQSTTLELTDARGEILAWAGRHWRGATPFEATGVQRDSATVIAPTGAFLVLSVFATRDSGKSFAVVSTPVQIDEEAVARLFPVPSLTSILHELAGTHATFESIGNVNPLNLQSPVVGLRGEMIACLSGPSIDGPAQEFPGLPAIGPTILLVLTIVFGWTAFWTVTGRLHDGMSLTLRVAAVWVTRYALLLLGIPGRFDLGPLVDSAAYGSPFGNGITGTPLDLLLSAIALTLSLAWLEKTIDGRLAHTRMLAFRTRRLRWLSLAVMIVVVSALLIAISRAFAASIKSIVVDSTLKLYDSLNIVPDAGVVVLLTASLLLTACLIISWTSLLRYMASAASGVASHFAFSTWVYVVAGIAFAVGVFTFVDSSGVLPLTLPVAAVVVGILLADPERISSGRQTTLWTIRAVAVIVLALPVIDSMVRQKSRDGIRHEVEDKLRPEDSWFSFLLSTDLAALSRDAAETAPFSSAANGIRGTQAFRLWARTTISRQPLNSGVVLYDAAGRETDRFVVGFSSFEQQMALNAVFQGDEETAQTLDSRSLGSKSHVYGMWGTFRNSENGVLGSLALILSPAEEEPLLLAVAERSSTGLTQAPEVEYLGGEAVRSTDPYVRSGSLLGADVFSELESVRRNWVWTRSHNRDADILYVRDPAVPGRILAVAFEDQDIRWQVFHAVRIIAVYAMIVLLVLLVRWVVRWFSGTRNVMSFRTRLFLAFGSIAVIPLILLAIYNQSLSEERTSRSIRTALQRELSQVVQRMNASVQSEEDIDRGVTDDFCSSVAAELDIEFSFFRGERLQASSRPELYASSLLGDRVPGKVFAAVQLLSDDLVVETQRIGSVTYAVGYGPWIVNGRPAGILSVPTLNRQMEIEQELAERNAYILVAYAVALVLMLVVGGYLSERIARPLRELTATTRELGQGRVVPVTRSSRTDEVGELINAFDDMLQQLETSRQQLARAEREHAWKEMAKQVAHEIKNPLTPMKLSVQHLRQAFKDKARDRERILAQVTKMLLEQIDTLSRIATEFAHFARLPQRTFERVDVCRVIREVKDLFTDNRGIAITLRLPKEAVLVIADADELQRVFINLFRNSIQAMSERGSIDVSASVERGMLHVVFADSGPGVPEHLRSRIFEPSFSTKTEGMGLGLAIVRRVIEDMGGTITLRPIDKGAAFDIHIPI